MPISAITLNTTAHLYTIREFIYQYGVLPLLLFFQWRGRWWWYDDGAVFERKRGKRAALRRHNTSKYIFIFHIIRASNSASTKTNPSPHTHVTSIRNSGQTLVLCVCIACVRRRATRRDEHSSLTDEKKHIYNSGMLLLLFSFTVWNTKCHVFCRFVNEGFRQCTTPYLIRKIVRMLLSSCRSVVSSIYRFRIGKGKVLAKSPFICE